MSVRLLFFLVLGYVSCAHSAVWNEQGTVGQCKYEMWQPGKFESVNLKPIEISQFLCVRPALVQQHRWLIDVFERDVQRYTAELMNQL